MHALAAAHELRLDTVIDQLLQDFLQVCPDDYSQQFVTECLPLLFSIFRYSKVCVSNNFILDVLSAAAFAILSSSLHCLLIFLLHSRFYE
jgi:ankyrin repeat and BTB/POZ domain-containing protein 2